jgi:tetratricopeptide (TPR) repeat protein
MPDWVAVLLLGRSALLAGNWWVVRALRAGDGRDWSRLLWAALGIAVLAALADLALAHGAGALSGALPEGFGLAGTAALVMLDGGFTAMAGVRAARAVPARRHWRRAVADEAAGRRSVAALGFAAAAAGYRRAGQPTLELDALDAQARCLLADGQAGLAATVYDSAAERAGELPVRQPRELIGAGDARWCAGEVEGARATYQAAAGVAQAAREPASIIAALERLAWLEFLAGDVELAGGYLAWATRAAGFASELASAASLMQLAACRAVATGHVEAARPAAEDAMQVAGEAGDPSLAALGRLILGCVHYLEGWDASGRRYIADQAVGDFDLLERRRAEAILRWISGAVRLGGRDQDADGFLDLATTIRGRPGTRPG